MDNAFRSFAKQKKFKLAKKSPVGKSKATCSFQLSAEFHSNEAFSYELDTTPASYSLPIER